MFTYEQIKELVELVGRHRLHSLEIERAGFRLRLASEPTPTLREAAAHSPAASPAHAAPAPAPSAVAVAPAAPPAAAPATPLHVVASPIVGTFYASPSPDSPPFVKVGDAVRKGQVVCIVEAMKLMNEIEADADGVIAEIYPKNAQPVEYGEPLFGLRAD